jgi:hypothetical protein
MTDREHSPAFQMLRRHSFTSFRLDHHIGRRAISPSLKLLDHLGLIDQMPNSPS